MKRHVALLFIILAIFPLSAAFSLPFPEVFFSVSGGIIAGEAREFVYSDSKVLSDLEWPMHPVYSFGIATSLEWQAGFKIGVSLSAGLPGESGTFKDSDFANLPESSAKTHYSQHDGYLEHAIEADVSVSWNFPVPVNGPASSQKIGFEPSIGFKYMVYKWTGRDGYKQYPPEIAKPYTEWSDDTDKTPMYGTVIAYQQQYWIPVAGITMSLPVKDKFFVSLSAEGSPYIWCTAVDNHIKLTGTSKPDEFYDIMEGGFMVEPALALEWRMSEKTSVHLDGRWTWIAALHGNTYNRYTMSNTIFTTYESNGDGGGASLNAVKITLGIKMQVNKD